MSELRKCSKCQTERPLEEFYWSVSRRSLQVWCKTCYRTWYLSRSVTTENDDPRTCRHCGKTYRPKQRKRSWFCSQKCKEVARNKARQEAINAAKPDRACVWCGESIAKTERADKRFCSEQCNSAAHTVTRKIAKRAGRNGRGADPLLSRDYIAKRDNYRCGICGGKVNMTLSHPDPMCPSIDHILPVAAGGSNDLSNLQLSHLRCNLIKRDQGTQQLRIVG